MSVLFQQCQAHTSSQTLTVNPKVYNNRSLSVNPHEPDYWNANPLIFSLPPLLMAHLVSAVPIQVPFFPEEVQRCSVNWRLPSPSGHLWSCPLALLQLSWWGHFMPFLLLMFLVVTISTVACTTSKLCTEALSTWSSAAPFEWFKSVTWQPMMILKGFWTFYHSLRLRTFVVDFS